MISFLHAPELIVTLLINKMNVQIFNMEEKILLSGTWLFAIIGMITLNSAALILSMVASVTVIIRNRNEVIEMVSKNIERFNNWLKSKQK